MQRRVTEQTCKTIREALRAAQAALAPVAGEEAAREARLFFCHALGWDMARLLSRQTDIFPGEYEKMLGEMLARRLAGEPLQYILGEWELMGLPFRVDARALIPRQDTETLVEAALGLIKERGYRTVLDLCCGSGAVGISLAKISSNVKVLGTDVSEKALAVAEENAKNLRVKMRFARGDMFAPAAGKKFDMIVSNPPYIRTRMISILQEEVKDHEPLQALDGGRDGLDFYRVIVKEAADHLKPGGFLLLEIGHDQGEDLRKMIRDDGRYTPAEIIRDLPGKDRVVKCEIRDKNEHRAEAKGVTEEQGEDQ